MYGRLLQFLRLDLTRGSVTLDLDIPFDGGSLNQADDLVRVLAKNGGAGKEE